MVHKPKRIFTEEWDTRGEWGEVKPTNNYEIVGLDLYYKNDKQVSYEGGITKTFT